MFTDYSLTPRQALICRIAAGLFVAVAVIEIGALLFALIAPNVTMRWHCGAEGCAAAGLPDLALTAEQLKAAGATAGNPAGWADRIGAPSLRLAQAVTTLAAHLPLAALLCCVAASLWRLSARGAADLAGAMPWLSRASACALLYALVPPLAEVARTSLLLSAIAGERMFFAELDVKALLINLLLALLAFTVSWALAAGSRAQSDIAEIV